MGLGPQRRWPTGNLAYVTLVPWDFGPKGLWPHGTLVPLDFGPMGIYPNENLAQGNLALGQFHVI